MNSLKRIAGNGMTTEGSFGSFLIHTLLSPIYGYDLERIYRMSLPLSLDFNPRSLVVDSSISYSLASNKPSPSLNAIFVPFRDRPEYVSELLKILPENETPIFLLPSLSLDLDLVEIGSRRHVEALFMGNYQGWLTKATAFRSVWRLCQNILRKL